MILGDTPLEKMTLKRVLPLFALVLLILLSLILLSGCSNNLLPSKPMCTVDADCRGQGQCKITKCVSGNCRTQDIPNCCGNRKCEEGEDLCSCSADCNEKCEGSVEFKLPGEKLQTAKYFQWGCASNASKTSKGCIIRYNPIEIDPRTEYHEITKDGLVMGITIEYDLPLVINQRMIQVEIQLKDYDKEKIKLPAAINEIRFMDKNLVLGRLRNIQSSKRGFTSINSYLQVQVPLTYSMQIPEEQRQISIEIDYQAIKLKKVKSLDSEGKQITDAYNQPVYAYLEDGALISKDKKSLNNKIYFLDPNYNELKIDFSQD